MSKITFETRTLSDRYRIIKVNRTYHSEETVCEIKIGPDSDQYCRIICEALNKKYKKKKKK